MGALWVECVSLVMKGVGEVTLLESPTASWGQRCDSWRAPLPSTMPAPLGSQVHFTGPRAPAMTDGESSGHEPQEGGSQKKAEGEKKRRGPVRGGCTHWPGSQVLLPRLWHQLGDPGPSGPLSSEVPGHSTPLPQQIIYPIRLRQVPTGHRCVRSSGLDRGAQNGGPAPGL